MAKRGDKHDGDGGFLSRWSERKRGGAEKDLEASEIPRDGATEETAGETEAWSEEQVQAKLSEIDEMKQGDDFKSLLAAGVPEVVKRAALRKLWRSNPVFGILDGLNDYDLDYRIKPGLVEQVRSAYQAGKGYVYDEEKEAERQAEIAARRDRDKQRERERAEAESAARSKASEPGAGTGTGTGEECAMAEGESASETAEPERQGENAPTKARGSAAARRWGGESG